VTISDYVAIGLLAVCLTLWAGTALLARKSWLACPHNEARGQPAWNAIFFASDRVGARLSARCVCFQPMGDLMLGAHSHD